ncbi:hypothetical protein, partial [Enterococcus casseliflavus]|uniref:hypothetical protein n=1 Tax=Enterococcus casseliflavus TaxID=37734 RepID=UPI003D14465C
FRIRTSADLPPGTSLGAVGTGAPAALKAMLAALPAIARPVVPALLVGGRPIALPTLAGCQGLTLAPIWPNATIARRNVYR